MSYSKFYSFSNINWVLKSEDDVLLEKLSVDFALYEIEKIENVHFEIQIKNNSNESFKSKFLIKGKSYRFSLGWKKRSFQFDKNFFGHEQIGNGRILLLYGPNFSRLREVVLAYVNSVVGEICDLSGWHRLHALGIANTKINDSTKTKCVIVPLDSASGKSSFTFWCSINSEYKILSDETILTDGSSVKGFFTRIALRTQPNVTYEIYNRQGQGPKYLLEVDRDRITQKTMPFYLWLPQNKWSKLKFIISFCFGLGSAQMIEFMLRFDNLYDLTRIFLSRAIVAIQLVKKIQTTENWQPLEQENFKVIQSLTN